MGRPVRMSETVKEIELTHVILSQTESLFPESVELSSLAFVVHWIESILALVSHIWQIDQSSCVARWTERPRCSLIRLLVSLDCSEPLRELSRLLQSLYLRRVYLSQSRI